MMAGSAHELQPLYSYTVILATLSFETNKHDWAHPPAALRMIRTISIKHYTDPADCSVTLFAHEDGHAIYEHHDLIISLNHFSNTIKSSCVLAG